jgi:spermidine/putrescine transport system substrate-binding protein
MARRIDRRELLQGGAGLAIAAGLAGCGVGNSSSGSKEETEKPIKKRVDGDLVYFNYSEYIDPDLVKGFEKRYAVKVRESYFDSMSAMMAKLRAGIQYDVIFPSAEYAQRLIQGNLIRKIDRDRLRNVDTVYELFEDPWYDPGSEHTTPYSMYMTGLGYRTDKVTGMTGSWRDLGQADSQDRSFLLDDYQEAVGMANLVNGYPLNETDPDKLERSKQYWST